ncbi:RNA polymerase sigma factor [Gayadomonas joobiniege]|uniref:RNA polymerase sigma factor n=1 Tax=Gayadomonas joobiniege TaxID=1234606 RepID=UPI0003735CAE|nr:sigma-70 family RNA polymerase sigma factor [Gayadomonas joobiniege]
MPKHNKPDHSASDDRAVIQAVLNGQLQAYSILVERHQSAVKSSLRLRLPIAAEAEDLTQEAFILAYNKLVEFDHSQSFAAWVRGIGLNLVKNHRRKQARVELESAHEWELEQLLTTELEHNFDFTTESNKLLALETCFEKLNEQSRELMSAHYQQGFSLVELGKKYQLRHSAMTMRMFRIREKLAQCINRQVKRLEDE